VTAPFWARGLLLAPALAVLLAFFLLPLSRLVGQGADPALYWRALTEWQYVSALLVTVALSVVTAACAVGLAAVVAGWLAHRRFFGRRLLVAMLTMPVALPGVVIAFMMILLMGRQGLLADVTDWLTGERVVLAYTIVGLFAGYLYFSLPRCIATLLAAAEAMDPSLEEAARMLGAGPWKRVRDVWLPGLAPALVASGAICFATSMGALGTAFTLAADIRVLPMVIYTEFTLATNLGMAAALSVILGVATWVALAIARSFGGGMSAAA
jgi:putative spermidine/putrescine transport system permease protein